MRSASARWPSCSTTTARFQLMASGRTVKMAAGGAPSLIGRLGSNEQAAERMGRLLTTMAPVPWAKTTAPTSSPAQATRASCPRPASLSGGQHHRHQRQAPQRFQRPGQPDLAQGERLRCWRASPRHGRAAQRRHLAKCAQHRLRPMEWNGNIKWNGMEWNGMEMDENGMEWKWNGMEGMEWILNGRPI